MYSVTKKSNLFLNRDDITSSKDLALNFEKCLDYILTTKKNSDVLLGEIINFTTSNSEMAPFFASFNDKNDYFSLSNTLSRGITYFVGICYLKELYAKCGQPVFVKQSISYLNPKLVDRWLQEQLPNQSIKINGRYLEEIFIKDSAIYFKHQLFAKSIKLNKLENYLLYTGGIKSTKRAVRLGIAADKIYNNSIYVNGKPNNSCMGAVKFVISNWFKQDLLPYNERKLEKDKFFKSLELKDNQLINKNTENLIFLLQERIGAILLNTTDCSTYKNPGIIELIIKCYNYLSCSDKGFDGAENAIDIFCTGADISRTIKLAIDQLKVKKLDRFYIEIMNKQHAVGLSIKRKGTGWKFVYYDSDEKDVLYKKCFLQESCDHNDDSYTSVFSQFGYLNTCISEGINLAMFIKIYTLPCNQYTKPAEIIVGKELNVNANNTVVNDLRNLAKQNGNLSKLDIEINNLSHSVNNSEYNVEHDA